MGRRLRHALLGRSQGTAGRVIDGAGVERPADARFRERGHAGDRRVSAMCGSRLFRSAAGRGPKGPGLQLLAAIVLALIATGRAADRATTIVGADLADGTGAPLRRANVRMVGDRI